MDDWFLIIQATTDTNGQDYNDKMKKQYSKLDKQDSKIDNIKAMVKKIMNKIQISNSSPDKMYSSKV